MSELKIISGNNKVKTRIIYNDINVDIDVLAKTLNMQMKGMKNRLARFRRGEITAEQVMTPLSDNSKAVINLVYKQLESNKNKRFCTRDLVNILDKDSRSISNALCQLFREGRASKNKNDDKHDSCVYYTFKEQQDDDDTDPVYDFLKIMAKSRAARQGLGN